MLSAFFLLRTALTWYHVLFLPEQESDEELAFEMMYSLVDVENKATSLNQRKGILDELEACITHTFYRDEDDATIYYQDRISRKKDLGGKYNEKFFSHIQEEGDEFTDNESTDVDATAGGGEE